MFGFGKRQGVAVDANALSNALVRLGELESTVRRLERDLEDMHARYVKARRASSAEARNQEREAEAAMSQAAAASQGRLVLATPESSPWGARGRRQARNGGGE